MSCIVVITPTMTKSGVQSLKTYSLENNTMSEKSAWNGSGITELCSSMNKLDSPVKIAPGIWLSPDNSLANVPEYSNSRMLDI